MDSVAVVSITARTRENRKHREISVDASVGHHIVVVCLLGKRTALKKPNKKAFDTYNVRIRANHS